MCRKNLSLIFSSQTVNMSDNELNFSLEEVLSPCAKKNSPIHEMLMEDGNLKTIEMSLAQFNLEYGFNAMERWASYYYPNNAGSCRQPVEVELREFMRIYPTIKDKIVNPFSIDIPDDFNIDDVINAELLTGDFVTPVTPEQLNTHDEEALHLVGVDPEVTIFCLEFIWHCLLQSLV